MLYLIFIGVICFIGGITYIVCMGSSDHESEKSREKREIQEIKQNLLDELGYKD